MKACIHLALADRDPADDSRFQCEEVVHQLQQLLWEDKCPTEEQVSDYLHRNVDGVTVLFRHRETNEEKREFHYQLSES